MWIVVDLNPERDLLKMLAAELSNRRELFEIFRDAKINLSFLGLPAEAFEAGNYCFAFLWISCFYSARFKEYVQRVMPD